MKRTMTRTGLSAAVLGVVLACAMLLMAQTVYADSPTGVTPTGVIKWGKKMTVSTEAYGAIVDMGSKVKGAKSITIKSSNKKVATNIKDYTDEMKVPVLNIEGKGTTNLTIKVKTKKGTKTYKGKLKVVKYKNPIKKFKLSGKNVAKKFKKYPFGDYTVKSKKSKLVIKPNKGWKVKKIEHVYGYSGKFHKVKNNSTIKWKDSGMLYITMYNKSKNQTETLFLSYTEPEE